MTPGRARDCRDTAWTRQHPKLNGRGEFDMRPNGFPARPQTKTIYFSSFLICGSADDSPGVSNPTCV